MITLSLDIVVNIITLRALVFQEDWDSVLPPQTCLKGLQNRAVLSVQVCIVSSDERELYIYVKILGFYFLFLCIKLTQNGGWQKLVSQKPHDLLQLATKLSLAVARWWLMPRSIWYNVFTYFISFSSIGNKYLLFSPFFPHSTFIIQSFLHQEVYQRHTLILFPHSLFELLSHYSRKISPSLFIHLIHSTDIH